MMRQDQWAVGSSRWAVRSRTPCCAHGPTAHRPLPPARAARRALTLIELLVTMTIIAMVSAAILGTASAAIEAGRRSRTQSLITKINGLLMERWDSYAERRVEIAPNIVNDLETKRDTGAISLVQYGQMLADARLLARRELMKMEMPDRWSDVVRQDITTGANPNVLPSSLSAYPGITQVYRRMLFTALNGFDVEAVLANQRAECLYATVMNHTGDGEARTLFTPQDISDIDGDGLPEFVDGWGQPIQWLRWPAGFVFKSAVMTGDADGDHDPFDEFRRDSPAATTSNPPNPPPPALNDYPLPMRQEIQLMRTRNAAAGALTPAQRVALPFPMLAFRLTPLVFSGGPDQSSAYLLSQEVGNDGQYLPLDPYFASDEGYQSGAPDPDDDAWKDNITNHLNEY